jgi:hypothetical protein
MKSSLLAFLVSLFLALSQCIASPVRLRKRDADFNAVRTRLTRSRSGEPGDPKEKYFHESVVCRLPLQPQKLTR